MNPKQTCISLYCFIIHLVHLYVPHSILSSIRLQLEEHCTYI